MISNLRVNNMLNPFGIEEKVDFSFIATKGDKFLFHLLNEDKEELYSQEVSLKEAIGFKISYPLEKGKLYFFNITNGNEKSEIAKFLIADDLDAPFISTTKEITHPIFFKRFTSENIKSARVVITGVGLYQAFINNKKVGDAYLTPGFNDYDAYLRYQEYDITDLLDKENQIDVYMGDGIYKGRMGFDYHPGNIWGDDYALSLKIIIVHNDGKEEIIKTDNTFLARKSEFTFSTIYDGEIRDATIDDSETFETFIVEKKFNLLPQFNPLIREKNRLKPELIITPKGEKVLDFKQNMVGFVSFRNTMPKGKTIHLQYGEVLQQGNFYNENLRSAKQELFYTSSGKECIVNSMFTFYGFRYVKVEGLDDINLDDFVGIVIHTDLEQTLECVTSDLRINRLIKNALWGQKGNFLDVPTDCPQRDERLGWTGDSQVFSKTASMNMNTKLFYKKFLRDLRYDQTTYYDGDIPAYSPSLKKHGIHGGAVWADAATIIPMNIYDAYGDKDLLKENYSLMKDYVGTLINADIEHGNTHLINYGFTFGDWLAMDGLTSQSRKGGTEDGYIQTMYFYNSLKLIQRAANVLSLNNDEKYYKEYAENVKQAILKEYFSPNGRLCIDTQTGYILALYFKIYTNKDKLIEGLKTRLSKDIFTMKSGFVGAPLAINTLLDNGLDDDAFRMLFSRKCPGWLFAVEHGATTIWERWNSILEDGTISGTDMNSLNHYAYGSVCESIYTCIAGLKNIGTAWDEVLIEPHLNFRLKEIDMTYHSVRGDYHIDYHIFSDNTFQMTVSIPHGCKAKIKLPLKAKNNEIFVTEGEYLFTYSLSKDLCHPFNMFSSFVDILENEDAVKACSIYPSFIRIASENDEMKILSPFVLTQMGYLPVTIEQAKEIDKELKKVVA